MMIGRKRLSVAVISLSAAGFAAWISSEGDGPVTVQNGVEVLLPYIPTKGDVPTIGHGSTRYEDGTQVSLSDPPITRERAKELARALHSEEEKRFQATLLSVELYQEEYDLYLDFVGQFGIGNWRSSSMLKDLKAGKYRQACDDLLKWRKQDGRDCSLQKNWGASGCKGVWTRQQERHAKCLAVQKDKP
jgi:lysozyme